MSLRTGPGGLAKGPNPALRRGPAGRANGPGANLYNGVLNNTGSVPLPQGLPVMISAM